MTQLITEKKGQLTCTATILNQRGLHARAAAKFVKIAGKFQATCYIFRRIISL